MENKHISNIEITPPEALHEFYQEVKRANLENPNLFKTSQKYPNGRIYIKHQITETGDRIRVVGSKLGEDIGEIVKFESGLYLVKISPNKYAALQEKDLDLVQ